MSALRVAAILLAGGRASRLDGVDKPLLRVGGEAMLDAAIAAVRDAGADPVIAVGPDRGRGVVWAREEPPFAGPAAAIVAGARVLVSQATGAEALPLPEWTFVLACDQPNVRGAVAFLAQALPLLPDDTDGVCVAGATSRPQWLTGAYRTRALDAAASALPDGGRNAPVREVMTDLAIAALADPSDLSADIDTWEDASRFDAER